MKILLIEDSSAESRLVQMELEKLGLEVIMKDRVPEKWLVCHVILTSLELRRTSDEETINAIRKIWPMHPLVALTGSKDYLVHSNVLEAGASAVFCKGEQDITTIVRAMKTAVNLQEKSVALMSDLLARAKKVLEELDIDND